MELLTYLITTLKYIFNLAWSQHTSASSILLDPSIQVHLQSSILKATNCMNNYLNYCLEVHLPICTHTTSILSRNSLAHHLPVIFQPHLITASSCISILEQSGLQVYFQTCSTTDFKLQLNIFIVSHFDLTAQFTWLRFWYPPLFALECHLQPDQSYIPTVMKSVRLNTYHILI